MRRILFVLGDLSYRAATTQLTMLLHKLPRAEFESHVCVLGGRGPALPVLANLAVNLTILDWQRSIDLGPAWRFRRLIQSMQPDLTHTLGNRAMSSLALVARGRRGKWIASGIRCPLAGSSPRDWLERRLLRRADAVVVSRRGDFAEMRDVGVTEDRLHIVPPGVSMPNFVATPGLRQRLGIAPDARILVCVSPFEPHNGHRDAVWAFDILRYLYDNLHLVFIGDGPDRQRLEQFARTIRGQTKVLFAGSLPDAATLLQEATIVWVPNRRWGGRQVVLEAMAAGRPTVAYGTSAVAEVIGDQQSGILVPPGDTVALARQTRLLLDDPGRLRKVGEVARERVREKYSADPMVHRYVELYQRLAQ